MLLALRWFLTFQNVEVFIFLFRMKLKCMVSSLSAPHSKIKCACLPACLQIAALLVWSSCGGEVGDRLDPPAEKSKLDCGSADTTLAVTATAKSVDVHPVSTRLWGANMVLEGAAPLDTLSGWKSSISTDIVRSLGVKVFRFPGGCVGDIYIWNREVQKDAQGAVVKDAYGEVIPTKAAVALRVQDQTTRQWTNVEKSVMTIEEGLRYADDMGAEMLFQINLQDVLENGEVVSNCYGIPAYPHFTSTPFTTPEQNEAILLQDALSILRKYARAGSARIHMIQLGNEEWFFPNDDYRRIATNFAKAIRNDSAIDPNLKIYLSSSHGNSTFEPNDFGQKRDDAKSVTWEKQMQSALATRCQGARCIDGSAVHPYSDSGFDPFMSQFPWNFRGELAFLARAAGAREMVRKHRLLTASPEVAVSEWNNWCGIDNQTPLTFLNPSFEKTSAANQPTSWNAYSSDASRQSKIGWSYGVTAEDATDQKHALKITLAKPSGAAHDLVSVSQPFVVDAARSYLVRAYIKTNKPARVQMMLQSVERDGLPYYDFMYPERNQDCSKAKDPASCEEFKQRLRFDKIKPNAWQGVSVRVGKEVLFAPAAPLTDPFPEGTTKAQVVFLIEKSDWASDPDPVTLYVDDVKVYDVTQSYPRDWQLTADHAFYVGETLLTYAEDDVSVAILHALNPDNDKGNRCSLFAQKKSQGGVAGAVTGLNAVGKAFALTSAWAGGDRFSFDVQSETFHTPDSPCTTAWCVPGNVDVPHVSVYGGHAADAKTLIFFVNNRSDSKTAAVRIKIPNMDWEAYSNTQVTSLSAHDYTDKVLMESSDASVSRGTDLEVCVPARSMNRIEVTP